MKGVEETVPMDLISPSGGAHLISGIGDVHGFVHDRFDMPPPKGLLNPDLPHTENLDWAGGAPKVLVRSAAGYFPDPKGASLGWSDDGGRSWHELIAPPVRVGAGAAARIDADGKAPITVSADGKTFVISGSVLLATADRGRSWWRPRGVPGGVTALADKVNPLVWFAVDYAGGKLFVSRDGARSFKRAAATGLPSDISGRLGPYPGVIHPASLAVPGKAGELWLLTTGHFYRSTDFARSFTPVVPKEPLFRDMAFLTFGLGKAAPGASFRRSMPSARRPPPAAFWRGGAQSSAIDVLGPAVGDLGPRVSGVRVLRQERLARQGSHRLAADQHREPLELRHLVLLDVVDTDPRIAVQRSQRLREGAAAGP